MLEQMKSLLRPSARAIGLDIGSGAIKLVEIKRGAGGIVLNRLGLAEFTIGAVEDGRIINRDAVLAALRQAILISGTNCKDTVMAVNGRTVFVREISMPAMKEAELKSALVWELEKYVPYPAEKCYYDFAVIGQGQSELETRILFVAIPREQVDGMVELVREAGLRPRIVDIEPLAIFRTLDYAENSMLVDIGEMTSQFLVFRQGIPVISRTVAFGGRRFTEVITETLGIDYSEAERFKHHQKDLLPDRDSVEKQSPLQRKLMLLVEELIREVHRTVEYYHIENRELSVEKIILSGGGALLSRLALQMAALLDTEVVVHDPLYRFRLTPSLERQTFALAACRFSVAAGLGLRGVEI